MSLHAGMPHPTTTRFFQRIKWGGLTMGDEFKSLAQPA